MLNIGQRAKENCPLMPMAHQLMHCCLLDCHDHISCSNACFPAAASLLGVHRLCLLCVPTTVTGCVLD
jgi:hypothetical protein